MKISCKTSELLSGLTLVGRAIGSQQALPILGNVLIQAEGKRCTLSATDLELSITTSFAAEIENEGAITVPAKAIMNFAQYNSDESVLLETIEGTQLRCVSARAKTLIAGEAAAEYPTITPIEKETSFSLQEDELLDALHLVTFSCAKSSLRPVLSGVYVHGEKGRLTLVATDSYRLSEYRISVKGGGDVSCIVPAKVLEELRSILGSKKAKKSADKEKDDKKEKNETVVTVTLSRQQIEFKVGATDLLSRLIDGKFPNYEQIIPEGHATLATFSAKELVTTVRRMHYFAKEMNSNITFRCSKNGVYMTTPQTQAGKDEATLSVSVGGAENTIALSSSYLLDFLAHMEGDEVEMGVMDSMHPAVFRIPKKDSFLHLVMPLRLQEENVAPPRREKAAAAA